MTCGLAHVSLLSEQQNRVLPAPELDRRAARHSQDSSPVESGTVELPHTRRSARHAHSVKPHGQAVTAVIDQRLKCASAHGVCSSVDVAFLAVGPVWKF